MAFSTSRYQVVEGDLRGRSWIVDLSTNTRYEITGAGQLAAAKALFPTSQLNDLTGWNEGPTVVDLYGGPNGIEQVVAGMRPDPLVGELNPSPSDITSISDIPYQAVPSPSGEPTPPRTRRSLVEELRDAHPHYPPEFIAAWADAWTETGNEQLALEQVRQHDRYEQWFPGIRRDDGSLRFDEPTYMITKRGYDETFRQFGIDPKLMQPHYRRLFEGEKSAQEVRQEIGLTYEMILSGDSNVRQWYAENFGAGGISDSAILASAVLRTAGETVDPMVLENELRTAQIGGEFRRSEFDLTLQEASRLAQFGLTQDSARRLAQSAAIQLPMLEALATRHNDPDDDLDLNEFLDAAAFQDPDQIARFERLLTQEASTFSPTSGTLVRDRAGGVAGLTPR